MSRIAIAFGVLLIIVSLLFRFMLGVEHFTAFIPAVIGVLL
jgi:hypothetical protein